MSGRISVSFLTLISPGIYITVTSILCETLIGNKWDIHQLLTRQVGQFLVVVTGTSFYSQRPPITCHTWGMVPSKQLNSENFDKVPSFISKIPANIPPIKRAEPFKMLQQSLIWSNWSEFGWSLNSMYPRGRIGRARLKWAPAVNSTVINTVNHDPTPRSPSQKTRKTNIMNITEK